MPAAVQMQTPARLKEAKALPKIEQEKDPLARRETLVLVHAYARIPDAAVRKHLADLIKTLAREN